MMLKKSIKFSGKGWLCLHIRSVLSIAIFQLWQVDKNLKVFVFGLKSVTESSLKNVQKHLLHFFTPLFVFFTNSFIHST